MTDSFVHLHQHTSYSLLDGASKIKDVVTAAKADGQPAISSTDHGNMYAILDMYNECEKQDVKFIPGFEAYQAKEHVAERPNKGKKKDGEDETEAKEKLYYHLTLLAENNEGYHNLIQLSSRAFLEGYYYKPRVDWDILEAHSKGVIATTGCLGGQVLQALMHGDDKGAIQIAGRLQDIFGKENLYVELQDHGIPEQKQTFPALLDVAKAIDAPLLATNDSHYVHKDDHHSHDALLCVQTGAKVSDVDRFKFTGSEHYLKSAAEMRNLFADHLDACDNTLAIAERSNVTIEYGKLHLPKFPMPAEATSETEYLRELVLKGAHWRWQRPLTEEQSDRLTYELGVINSMGFTSYFLILWDLCKYARSQGIRIGPGRGSAAGCAVAYCLRITDLDPIEHGLAFERFLNPSRVSMPDIDTDMDTRYRDQMIRYTSDRYGEDHVAQIITYSRIKARAAVRDAARVLDKPYALGSQLSKAMPPLLMGRDVSLAECFDQTSARYDDASGLRDIYYANPDAKEVVDVARGLEGLVRQDGIHAAAVVIGDQPLVNLIPIQRKNVKGKPGPIVTQYDMHGVEDLGLLKMDYLGLQNLDIITDTLAMIKKVRGEVVDIDNVPLDDLETFELLRAGETVGVFQVEGTEMRNLLRRLKPTEFGDIAAVVALYRPGPMAANMHNDYADRKNHRQMVQTFHADADEILKETYGLMIYQEQVMAVAQRFAGFTLADADLLRRAIGKKLPEKMAAEKVKFIEGCDRMGYDAEFSKMLFGIIERFADYSFNKSHAYGYGLITYQTAYLKTHFPAEYISSLASNAGDVEKAGRFLAEARRMGLEVRVPDVNTSGESFEADLCGLSVGLSAIKGIGDDIGRRIVQDRAQKGSYKDLFDFTRRICLRNENETAALKKNSLVAFAQAGALDSFGSSRRGIVGVAEEILKVARKINQKESSGQMGLFGEDEASFDFDISPIEYNDDEKLALEKKLMGIYVTGHPLDNLPEWTDQADVELAEFLEMDVDTVKTVVVVVESIETKVTRAGVTMADVVIEDLSGHGVVTVFARSWEASNLKVGAIAKLKLRLQMNWKDQKAFVLLAEEVREPEAPALDDCCRIYLPRGFRSNDVFISRLKSVILTHRGQLPVALYVSRSSYMDLGKDYMITYSPEFVGEVKTLMKEFANA